MFIKVVFILVLLIIIFLAFKFIFFILKNFIGVSFGFLKAIFWVIIILAIVAILIYFYFRYKTGNLFNLGL